MNRKKPRPDFPNLAIARAADDVAAKFRFEIQQVIDAREITRGLVDLDAEQFGGWTTRQLSRNTWLTLSNMVRLAYALGYRLEFRLERR